MLELNLPQNPSKGTYSRIKNPKRKIIYLFALHSSCQDYLAYRDKLGGILDLVEGLEYHFKKIKNYERAAYRRLLELKKMMEGAVGKPFQIPRTDLRRVNHWPASHEAVSYINRLGQLAYFFRSDWFRTNVNYQLIVSKIPSILALQPIRNKYTAHRQLDYPNKHDDCSSLGIHQYGLMHALVCPNGKPEAVRIQYNFPTKQRNEFLEKHRPYPEGSNTMEITTILLSLPQPTSTR